MDWIRPIPLYTKIPRLQMLAEGGEAITVRWVDVNQGDRVN